jgi:nicotinamidase-related amidase
MKSIHGFDIPQTLADVATPARMALLIYDMQAGIVSQVQGGETIVEGCRELVSAARAAGVRVVFTRHLSLSTAWMGASQYRMAMAWQGKSDPAEISPWFTPDKPGFQIVPELSPGPDDAVFDKITMSAFAGTPLALALRDCGVTAVAIAGIAMEVGIEPTARHAADLGFVPVIVEDAAGCGQAEAAARSIAALRFAGDALFTDVATLADLWRAPPDPG